MAQVNYQNNGLVLIKKVSGTTVSEINVDNCFSNDYSQYKIVQDLTVSSTSALNFRLRAGGTTNVNADYNYQFVQGASTAVNVARSTTATGWFIGYCGTGEKTCSVVEILNPYQTAYTTASVAYAQDATSALTLTLWAFGTDITTSYDGFTVFPGAGTISGTVYVYGYKES